MAAAYDGCAGDPARPTLYTYSPRISLVGMLPDVCISKVLSTLLNIRRPELRISSMIAIGIICARSICRIFCRLVAPSIVAAS